ncbi:MAG: hypothetical protein Q8L90_15550 [Bacteroidota bacterium]|nr:hypothetical protein [Bacteroidota bacterium]
MSRSIIKNKNVLSNIAAIVFFFIFSTASQAQGNSNNPTIDKKYVRVDIGHGAMHCPFLSPKLEAKLREIKNIENFFIDKRNSYATFNLPLDTEMTSETLKKIGTDVGYPADDVVITIDSKPIKVLTKQL